MSPPNMKGSIQQNTLKWPKNIQWKQTQAPANFSLNQNVDNLSNKNQFKQQINHSLQNRRSTRERENELNADSNGANTNRNQLENKGNVDASNLLLDSLHRNNCLMNILQNQIQSFNDNNLQAQMKSMELEMESRRMELYSANSTVKCLKQQIESESLNKIICQDQVERLEEKANEAEANVVGLLNDKKMLEQQLANKIKDIELLNRKNGKWEQRLLHSRDKKVYLKNLISKLETKITKLNEELSKAKKDQSKNLINNPELKSLQAKNIELIKYLESLEQSKVFMENEIQKYKEVIEIQTTKLEKNSKHLENEKQQNFRLGELSKLLKRKNDSILKTNEELKIEMKKLKTELKMEQDGNRNQEEIKNSIQRMKQESINELGTNLSHAEMKVEFIKSIVAIYNKEKIDNEMEAKTALENLIENLKESL